MSQENNISNWDKMIRSTMENAEVQAPDGVWEQLQPQIQAPAKPTSWFGSTAFKGMVAAVVVAGVAAAVYFSGNEEVATQDSGIVVEERMDQAPTAEKGARTHTIESTDKTVTLNNVDTKESQDAQSSGEINASSNEGDEQSVVAAQEVSTQEETGDNSSDIIRSQENNISKNSGNGRSQLLDAAYTQLLQIYLSDTLICLGESTTIGVMIPQNIQMFNKFEWIIDGKTMEAGKLSFQYTPNGRGKHTVTLIGVKDGERYSSSRYVSVFELNGAFEPYRLLDPRSIQCHVARDMMTSATWHFGDNQGWVETEENTINHTYQSLGVYPITAIVTNELGCIDTVKKVFEVLSPINVKWNIVSPTLQDGKNDVLEVEGEDITNYSIIIHDKYGDRVYEGNNIFESWDGRDYRTGEVVKAGTYVYTIRYTQGNSDTMEVTNTFEVK